MIFNKFATILRIYLICRESRNAYEQSCVRSPVS